MPFNINTMGYYSELDIDIKEEMYADAFFDAVPNDVWEEWYLEQKDKEEKFIEHQQECFNYDELPF